MCQFKGSSRVLQGSLDESKPFLKWQLSVCRTLNGCPRTIRVLDSLLQNQGWLHSQQSQPMFPLILEPFKELQSSLKLIHRKLPSAAESKKVHGTMRKKLIRCKGMVRWFFRCKGKKIKGFFLFRTLYVLSLYMCVCVYTFFLLAW